MGEYVHSQQVQFSKAPASCAILEVHHLPADTTGNQMVFAIANHMYHKANGRPGAFVLFSDVVGKDHISRGQLLAEAIYNKQAFKGYMYQTDQQVNPRTGNLVITWLWTINHEVFRAWYTEEYANRVDA